MTTLTAFLEARIEADEALAKRAAFGWGAEWRTETDSSEGWAAVHADGKRDMVGCEDGDVTHHIARHDPARVLAQCAAYRAIVATHPLSDEGFNYNVCCETCADSDHDGFLSGEWPCLTLRALAAIWSNHPDWRTEW